ncbi:hypothetical protein [Neobacillus endophyticus]|uniref:hypothetical protein n=1 Tax=Neobacillus endophyticus TaxID=2738405 RepID=UPI001FE76F30|nr:hypothetical protein [Neobacillus endophyticus]
MKKIKMDGFRMPQAILKDFYMIRDESFERPPASAYVVYLTMLCQLDKEKNQRGILKEYNLSYWAKTLKIPYSTFYTGKLYLEKYHFVKEEILNDLPVLVLKDIEKYNNPGSLEGGELNYLLIPHALFKTNILAELVRTSNPEGIELILSLFNQFRTAMSKKEVIELNKLRQSRNMSTLKKQLNKNSKKVREILTLLEPLFVIEYEGLEYRGKQIWVRKVWITIKETCVKEQNVEEFKVDHLMAMLSHELTYFLDGQRIKYKPRDQFDIMISYKQEVYDKVKLLKDHEQFNLESAIKQYFINCMDNIGIYIHQQQQNNKTFRIHSLGAFFRKAFRNYLGTFLKKIPPEVRIETMFEHYTQTGTYPDFEKIIL